MLSRLRDDVVEIDRNNTRSFYHSQEGFLFIQIMLIKLKLRSQVFYFILSLSLEMKNDVITVRILQSFLS